MIKQYSRWVLKIWQIKWDLIPITFKNLHRRPSGHWNEWVICHGYFGHSEKIDKVDFHASSCLNWHSANKLTTSFHPIFQRIDLLYILCCNVWILRILDLQTRLTCKHIPIQTPPTPNKKKLENKKKEILSLIVFCILLAINQLTPIDHPTK